ncbi:MAG: hypothetical protein J7639_01490 [Paenibacillaceae bacterium]|nr:hypothetical protein [Paenibacillaceae bacterium]
MFSLAISDEADRIGQISHISLVIFVSLPGMMPQPEREAMFLSRLAAQRQ